MTRDDYIDLYFQEMDMGPRWRLREHLGAPSPETEAREAAALAAASPATAAPRLATNSPLLSATPATPRATVPEQSQGFQKNPTDAAFSAPVGTAPSTNQKVAIAMPPATGRDGKNVPVAVEQVQGMDWDALEASIHDCRACGLCRQRRQAVPGIGDRQADWLFVGEGPGVEEDKVGEPFVGPAGKLLDNMLLAIGLKRGENTYIANAVKCRPPNNRTPEAAEMAACRPYLERQIALLKPKLIVVLGRAAAHAVLGSDEALHGLRGRVHHFGETPVVVTYHPAYLLRTLQDKAKAWEDLCLARRTMRELG